MTDDFTKACGVLATTSAIGLILFGWVLKAIDVSYYSKAKKLFQQ